MKQKEDKKKKYFYLEFVSYMWIFSGFIIVFKGIEMIFLKNDLAKIFVPIGILIMGLGITTRYRRYK